MNDKQFEALLEVLKEISDSLLIVSDFVGKISNATIDADELQDILDEMDEEDDDEDDDKPKFTIKIGTV